MRKPPVSELVDQNPLHLDYQGLPVLFYRAALPLSRKTLTFTAGIIRRHRRAIGSSWRKLNPGQQALLVLAYLRKGETFAELAAGFGVGTATAWPPASTTTRPPHSRPGPSPRQQPDDVNFHQLLDS